MFASDASTLVPGDTNDAIDVFVRDRVTGLTSRVSVASDGSQAHPGEVGSVYPDISDDGRYVVFASDAPDLIPGEFHEGVQVYRHDRVLGTTALVSTHSTGEPALGRSWRPSISGDGRHVAFQSYASNLVPGDTNGHSDVFVHDTETGETSRVSVASDGSQGNAFSAGPASISADGRYVAFYSDASNLVTGDTNGDLDVFVRDRVLGVTTRVSVGPGGVEANGWSAHPGISGDGRYVAFESLATNLGPPDTNNTVDVYVHDRATGLTTMASVNSVRMQGELHTVGVRRNGLSADGRRVVMISRAITMSPGGGVFADAYVHDRHTGRTWRVSVPTGGAPVPGADVGIVAISADGRHVAFNSASPFLAPPDTNGASDVFVRSAGLICAPDKGCEDLW